MDISAIIVSFNVRELLSACIKSVIESAESLKIEIFVVDNNSHDGSSQEVRNNFPNVKLLSNKKNLGFSKANNQAIKKAKGKYILILNPDTVMEKDTLLKMKQFMDKNPKIGISTCRVELPDGNLDHDCRRLFPTPWKALCHFSGISKLFRGSGVFDQYYMGFADSSLEHEIDACAGAFMLVRNAAIKKVGLFDEDFFFYGEDLDWCWRFKEKGYKIVYTPITKIVHYKGVSSGIKKHSKHLSKATKESKRKALSESTRAMELFYKKHYLNKYPLFITSFVIFSIKLLQYLRIAKSYL